MDFRRLEAFCKVYELKSFSKAGEAIFLSQPTVSSHVAQLEEELGVILFDRLGRSIIPTDAADVLYTTAAKIFTQIDNVVSEVHLLRDKVVGKLVVGGSTIPSHYILPSVLSDFIKNYPEVEAHMCVGHTDDIMSKVLNGDLVLGVIGAKPERPEITSFPLLKDSLVVVGSNAYKSVGDSFMDYPWIVREKGSGTRKAFELALGAAGHQLKNLNVTAWVDSTEAVLQCVKAGMGVSVTSRLAAKPYIDSGEMKVLSHLPFKVERSFHVIYRKGRNLYPACRYFIDYVKKSAEQIEKSMIG
ncbi:MAG: selenium metabolism-associated LysR family transcriptional regulator [Desulfovibrio sp.]